METDKQQARQTPFGAPVQGDALNDVAMVQQAFGVQQPYQNILLKDHLASLRQHFPLLAELGHAKGARMKIVALQGIHGGVGTTSIVAGLALAARELGARVLAIDMCPDNLLGVHLGLPHDETMGWSRLRDPAREWRSALYQAESGLDLLPQGGAAGCTGLCLAGGYRGL